MQLPLLDGFIVVILAVASYVGYKSGVSIKAFTLVALLSAVFVSARMAHWLGSRLATIGVASGAAADVLAFFLIFLVVAIVYVLLFRVLKNRKMLKAGAHAGGLALGAVEAVLALSMVLWALRCFDEPSQKLQSGSVLYRPVLEASPALCKIIEPFIPGAEEFRTLVGEKIAGRGK